MCAVARIAQSVEQRIENPRVRGSIPRPGTNKFLKNPSLSFHEEHWDFLCLTFTRHGSAYSTYHKNKPSGHQQILKESQSFFSQRTLGFFMPDIYAP